MHIVPSAEVLPLAARISALSDVALVEHVQKPAFRCSSCAAAPFVQALADRLVEAGKALTRERLETAALRDEVERELAGGSRLGKRVAELEADLAAADSILRRFTGKGIVDLAAMSDADLAAAAREHEGAVLELASVDLALSGREALRNLPRRSAKIEAACRRAGDADRLAAQVERLDTELANARTGAETHRAERDLAREQRDAADARTASLLEGQEALRAQTVRIRRALNAEAIHDEIDTEDLAKATLEALDRATAALEAAGFTRCDGPLGWKPPLGPVPERFREENAPRVLDFAGGAEPKTFSGPVSLDELEEAIDATRKGTEAQAFREGVIAARDLTCPGCGEGAPLTLSGTHHRGGSSGCCTNLCKAAAIRRELLGEEVGKIGTSRKIMGV